MGLKRAMSGLVLSPSHRTKNRISVDGSAAEMWRKCTFTQRETCVTARGLVTDIRISVQRGSAVPHTVFMHFRRRRFLEWTLRFQTGGFVTDTCISLRFRSGLLLKIGQESSSFCRILIFFSIVCDILQFQTGKRWLFCRFSLVAARFPDGYTRFRKLQPVRNPLHSAEFWYFPPIRGMYWSFILGSCV